jgi:hypothetical protein
LANAKVIAYKISTAENVQEKQRKQIGSIKKANKMRNRHKKRLFQYKIKHQDTGNNKMSK